VQAEIAVNEHVIVGSDRCPVIKVDHATQIGEQAAIVDHLGQALPDPVARFRPGGPRRQPSGDVVLRDARVLLDQRRSDGTADAARQGNIRQDTPIEAPGVAKAGHGSTEIPALSGFEQHVRGVERAARPDEAQHPSLADEVLAASRVRRKPGQTAVRQCRQATLVTRLDSQLRRRQVEPGFAQRGADRLWRECRTTFLVRHATNVAGPMIHFQRGTVARATERSQSPARRLTPP
jgi:hypothetical protein